MVYGSPWVSFISVFFTLNSYFFTLRIRWCSGVQRLVTGNISKVSYSVVASVLFPLVCSVSLYSFFFSFHCFPCFGEIRSVAFCSACHGILSCCNSIFFSLITLSCIALELFCSFSSHCILFHNQFSSIFFISLLFHSHLQRSSLFQFFSVLRVCLFFLSFKLLRLMAKFASYLSLPTQCHSGSTNHKHIRNTSDEKTPRLVL